MKNIPSKIAPNLYERCLELRAEISALCGLSRDRLIDVSRELSESMSYWYSDYQGPVIDDPFVGFCQLLIVWPTPWPFQDGSSLNGLRLSQFLLGFAYSELERALFNLEYCADNPSDCEVLEFRDDAACFALYATKAVMRAKSLIGSKSDQFAQAAPTVH